MTITEIQRRYNLSYAHAREIWDAQEREAKLEKLNAELEAKSYRPAWLDAMARRKEALARVAELERENTALLQANRDCAAWFDALNADHQKALKTLVDLACLGNAPRYGNSTGNVIAQRCLDSLID